MPTRPAKRSTKVPSERRVGTRVSERVVIAANEFIVGHYPIGCLGGTPHRLTLDTRDLWIVPIVLTSPGIGAVGEVGLLALDAATRQVVGNTPRAEVVAAGKRLREAKRDDLEAAFHRTRTI